MRTRHSHRSGASLLLLPTLLLGFALPSRAEVRAVEHPTRGWSVEIEPAAGGRIWTPVPAHQFDQDVLNPGGDLRADGRPAIGTRPGIGLPEAVYSMSTRQGYCLVLAQHDGSGWGQRIEIGRVPFASDLDPITSYDEAGRSMLLWRRTVTEFAVMVAGLSIDGRTWGARIAEPLGFAPVAMENDGHEYYFASLNPHSGLLRFRLVAFPFPNGGPALPFPDDSLILQLLEEVPTGLDAGPLPAGNPDPTVGLTAEDEPATLAGVTLAMHRHESTVWADWVTDHQTVRWIAFRNRTVIGDGEEAFRNPSQIDQARARVRSVVEGL